MKNVMKWNHSRMFRGKYKGIGMGLCVVLLLTASCDKWLDLKPYDGVVENEYWQTKEDVHSVLIGCYSSLLDQTMVSNMIYWGELRGDLVTGSSSASSGVMSVVRGEITPENAIVKWDQFFTTINYCNKVIEKSVLVRERDMSFTDDLYRQYKAEATAIRSLMYFYLVRSFSDVPFVTKASDDDRQDYYVAKIEGRAVLDSLVKHLENVLPDLPRDLGDNDLNKGRMTRWTGLALLADIYLWQGNYVACSGRCDQIITSGQFSLIVPGSGDLTPVPIIDPVLMDTLEVAYQFASSYADRLFDELYVTGNSVESIFELQFPKTHDALGDPFYALFKGTGNVPPLIPKEDNLLENIFPLYEYADINSTVQDVRGNSFTYKNESVWKWVGLSRSGSTTRTQKTFPHWIIYRYADILLMKAEALNQMGKATNDQNLLKESYALVQQIRTRGNAVDSEEVVSTSDDGQGGTLQLVDAQALEQLILDERAREFAGEGKRWYDVLRFALRDAPNGGSRYLTMLAITAAPPEKVTSLQEKYKNKWFLYWPIYVNAVEINKNLKQNEFYVR
ncbi:MAG: RagB/SusD family nutrient uptake outer membrane protein [Bacteroidales bacterium]|nr:RagB/SusD family nutrient uptake outer membrane protein [Bacteroidales bacterium]